MNLPYAFRSIFHQTESKWASVGLIGCLCVCLICPGSIAQEPETLPPLRDGAAPATFDEMWAGFDPQAEPLDVELLREWEQDDVVLRIVRFRVGVFKGHQARLAAIYGFPKGAIGSKSGLPGLLQIHGGGQYADFRACLLNAKRGYATLSIAWAGRINAPDYRVTPSEVKLFWSGETEHAAYKLTTDWGVLDGYHAPARNRGNSYPSLQPAAWTLDAVESPRNSGWFLSALAARRALTFLEQQPEVDPTRLGVYGHSMGGKLTVLAAVDPRVKAAAPSCGGISDRENRSPLFRHTLADDVSLRRVTCPMIFLSPSNDFHGRIGDLPSAVDELQSAVWRVTCSPHHNHQDTSEYAAATMLWFDEHLKGQFAFPQTPTVTLSLGSSDRVPFLTVSPDASKAILSVDVFYTQHGIADEGASDHVNVKHRFWRHASAREENGRWIAKLPVRDTDNPLWVFANVLYPLEESVNAAGYYYAPYTATSFNVSSVLRVIAPEELRAAGIEATLQPTLLIEDFEGNWEKEWFTYQPDNWARTTHKVYDEIWAAPENGLLALRVRAEKANRLVVMLDEYAAEVELSGGAHWQDVALSPSDFQNLAGESLPSWRQIKRLKLSAMERLRPNRGETLEPRMVGKLWVGAPPEFQELRWRLPDGEAGSP